LNPQLTLTYHPSGAFSPYFKINDGFGESSTWLFSCPCRSKLMMDFFAYVEVMGMRFLRKKIEISAATLISIIVATGVVSAHVAQSDFGRGIAEIVAVAGLLFVAVGVWLFLQAFRQLYGSGE